MQNLCEHLRQEAIAQLFKMGTMQSVWPVWQAKLSKLLDKPPYKASDIIALGDHLAEIFKSTGGTGRDQGSLSGGGAAWEGLVCWYLNLCLIGSRGIVVKQSKALIPDPISHAITVKYNNFKSNTESDLVGLVFPDKTEYTASLDTMKDYKTKSGTAAFVRGKLNYKPLINDLVDRDFGRIDAAIIQCKTNWNDNAQIPMLWDMIYRAKEFVETGIVVGDKSYSIRNLNSFKYCFVTVPSTKAERLVPTSTAVQRVRNISGGNYWGRPSVGAVAESVAEIFGRNFHGASSSSGLRADLSVGLNKIDTDYTYFKLVA